MLITIIVIIIASTNITTSVYYWIYIYSKYLYTASYMYDVKIRGNSSWRTSKNNDSCYSSTISSSGIRSDWSSSRCTSSGGRRSCSSSRGGNNNSIVVVSIIIV